MSVKENRNDLNILLNCLKEFIFLILFAYSNQYHLDILQLRVARIIITVMST